MTHEHHRSPSGHPHGHGHGHDHASAQFGRAFAIGISLNVIFVGVETAYGFIANSMALLADAGHNLSDVLGLVAAFAASAAGKRAPSPRFTYGWKRGSILASLFNAVCLLLAVGAIAWEAILRLRNPEPVAGQTIMAVAAMGIIINGVTAMLFARGRQHDLNIRGAFLHMVADALVSAGVVLAGLLVLTTGWLWIDPLVSLAIAAAIFWGTWGLLRESLALSMDAVPAHVDIPQLRGDLLKLNGVAAVHDLHVWRFGTTDIAMTAHLVMPAGHPGDGFYADVSDRMMRNHRINHVTLQIEADATQCRLAPDDVV